MAHINGLLVFYMNKFIKFLKKKNNFQNDKKDLLGCRDN